MALLQTGISPRGTATGPMAEGKCKSPAYPPLAGNRAVTLTPAVNAIRIVLARPESLEERGDSRHAGRPAMLPGAGGRLLPLRLWA
ncbi:hypothetical protein [Telluria aromaticivorans]|uniref:hypothetical protein n=1 Tax=Telluria aromaticivorans TaxID=2725995 RepID=UPI001BB1A5DD|nr:hypothetical protein [Telluria aromaticivorans]